VKLLLAHGADIPQLLIIRRWSFSPAPSRRRAPELLRREGEQSDEVRRSVSSASCCLRWSCTGRAAAVRTALLVPGPEACRRHWTSRCARHVSGDPPRVRLPQAGPWCGRIAARCRRRDGPAQGPEAGTEALPDLLTCNVLEMCAPVIYDTELETLLLDAYRRWEQHSRNL